MLSKVIFNQHDVVTFANGFVGAVTANGKVALSAPNGWLVGRKYWPNMEEYSKKHPVVRLETRPSQDAPLTLEWESQSYDFKNRCFRGPSHCNSAGSGAQLAA